MRHSCATQGWQPYTDQILIALLLKWLHHILSKGRPITSMKKLKDQFFRNASVYSIYAAVKLQPSNSFVPIPGWGQTKSDLKGRKTAFARNHQDYRLRSASHLYWAGLPLPPSLTWWKKRKVAHACKHVAKEIARGSEAQNCITKTASLFCKQIWPEWLRPSAGGGSVAPTLPLMLGNCTLWAPCSCFWSEIWGVHLSCKFMNQRRKLMWTAAVRIAYTAKKHLSTRSHTWSLRIKSLDSLFSYG